MRGIYFLLLALILAGCIYETPQSSQLSGGNFDSTDDLYSEETSEARDLGRSELESDYPFKYIIKGVENIFDECGGCLDYVAASGIAMRRFDSEMGYPFIASLSGALRLDNRQESVEEFFNNRIANYGFRIVASGEFAGIETEPVDNQETYIKSILNTDIVPAVCIDRYAIYEDQLLRYNEAAFNRSHEKIFVSAVGYDANKDIFINDPTVLGLKASYQNTGFDRFMDGWRDCGYFSAYFYPDSYAVSEEESLRIIKDDILASHEDIGRDELKKGYATRHLLYLYLRDIDMDMALRMKYSSLIFRHITEEKENFNKGINEIIEIEREAVQEIK
ncbi:hypothetical protein GF323_00530 [Candidatus Woesearchaeota archaeon]|nr:hypothetical protein [Candidatus Woesearchaeota archaeon]